jgi:hypothetical protein
MDIFSAITVAVPLIIPLGIAYGVHPVHLGIIFLANLELGYLTPPCRRPEDDTTFSARLSAQVAAIGDTDSRVGNASRSFGPSSFLWPTNWRCPWLRHPPAPTTNGEMRTGKART